MLQLLQESISGNKMMEKWKKIEKNYVGIRTV